MSGAADYRFHALVRRRGEGVRPHDHLRLRQIDCTTLAVPDRALAVPWDLSFEAFVEAVVAWPRMFIEPDGSFVWHGHVAGRRWQLEGLLVDRDERLLYVELHGTCPPEAFDKLLEVLGWPATEAFFQLVKEAVYLDEESFRRWAASLDGEGDS